MPLCTSFFITIATNRLARLLAAALEAKNITRRYTSGMINIFIGSHLFTEKTSKTTSAASVIMNSEIVDIHIRKSYGSKGDVRRLKENSR